MSRLFHQKQLKNSNNSPENMFTGTASKHPYLIIIPLIVLILLVVAFSMIISARHAEEAEGYDNSQIFDDSISQDQKIVTDQYGIYQYLPIVSNDPSFTISYSFTGEEFSIEINPFTASARTKAIETLLDTDFDIYDPLNYHITIDNYYNPLESISLDSKETLLESLPENFSIGKTIKLSNSYSSITIIHHLYDDSTNIYHLILNEHNKPVCTPSLIYSYLDLPDLSHEDIKLINSQGE